MPIIVSDLAINKRCRRLLDVNGGEALFNLADLVNAQELEECFLIRDSDADEDSWYELTPRQYSQALQLITLGNDFFINVYANGDYFSRREYADALGRGQVAKECGAPIVCRVHVKLKKNVQPTPAS